MSQGTPHSRCHFTPVTLGGAKLNPGSELPVESSIQQAEEGRGRWPSAQSSRRDVREGLKAEAEGSEDTPRPRSLKHPGLATWQNHSLHHPLSVLGINYLMAPGRIWELAGGCRQSAEACRAVFDAKYQKNPPRMDFYIFTFTIALIVSQVTSSLMEEVGCDKFINRK